MGGQGGVDSVVSPGQKGPIDRGGTMNPMTTAGPAVTTGPVTTTGADIPPGPAFICATPIT